MRDRWDERYRWAAIEDAHPVAVLTEYAHLLPAAGRAADLACGLGANALYLARRGLDTSAWDIAPSAIDKLGGYARRHGLAVTAEVRDVLECPPPAESFDVIVVGRFLERALAPVLTRALRPGGLLFYETFVREAASDCGPSDPRYRLAPNELLTLFAGLRVVLYRDEGTLGDTRCGVRDVAQLVAQRR